MAGDRRCRSAASTTMTITPSRWLSEWPWGWRSFRRSHPARVDVGGFVPPPPSAQLPTPVRAGPAPVRRHRPTRGPVGPAPVRRHRPTRALAGSTPVRNRRSEVPAGQTRSRRPAPDQPSRSSTRAEALARVHPSLYLAKVRHPELTIRSVISALPLLVRRAAASGARCAYGHVRHLSAGNRQVHALSVAQLAGRVPVV